MALVIDPQTGAYVDESVLNQPTEAATPERSGFLRRTLGDAATGLAKGVLVGVPQAAVGLARLGTLGMADPLLNPISDGLKGMGEVIDKKYSPEHQQQAKEVADTKGFLPTIGAWLSRPGYALDTIVEQLPAMAAGGVAGRAAVGATAMKEAAAAGPEALAALGTKAGAIGEALTTAGQNVDQVDQTIRDNTGESSSLGSKLLAGMGGVVTGGISFGSGKLANKLGISDLDTMLAGGGKGVGTGSMAGRVAKGVLTEGVLEELPQSMQEQMWNNAATDRPLTEGVAEAGAQGLVLGGAMGGGAQLTGKRVDPAAIAHNNRMRDALAGIAVLTEPQQLDASGAPVVTTDMTNSLAAIAKYAEHVEGADVAAVKEWQAKQLEALNQVGGAVSFDNVPGIADDASARAWAENRRAEIAAREIAGTPDQVTNVTDDYGNFVSSSTVPGEASRSLTKQEQAQMAQLDAALAAGDMETVARLQDKLYARPQQAAQATAPAAAPAAATPAAPAQPKPTDPRGWDDAKLAEESAKLDAADLSNNANKIRREAARRAEQAVVYDLAGPAPSKVARAYGMASITRSDGKNFSTAAATNVEKELAKRLPANATAGQLIAALRGIVSDLNVVAPATAELAGTYADNIENRGAQSVQAQNVSPGAGPQPAAGQANAANTENNSGPAAQGNAAAQPAQKAPQEVAPLPAAPPPILDTTVIRDAPAPQVELPKVGDRVATGNNRHGTVTEVTAKGGVHVTLDDGTKVTHTAKTIADGQLRVTPATEQKAAPAPEAKPTPKKEVEPTAEDWENAYAAAKEQADKLGLVLPKSKDNPVQASAALKNLAEKLDKVKDEAARTQMRALIVKAREAATTEVGRRKKAFEADLKAKDEKAAADATAVLQEENKKAREAMSPSELWDDIRGDKQLAGDRYIPTWAEVKQFMADIKEFAKRLPEIAKEQKALEKELKTARSAMDKVKKALTKVNDDLLKLRNKLATAEATGKGNAETLQAGIDMLVEDAKGHADTYATLQDRVAELDKQLRGLTSKVEAVEGAKQQIASLEAVLAKFQKGGLARSMSYTTGDLVEDVANSRLAPYLAKIRELLKADQAAASKKATYDLNKETLLELADIYHEKGGLTKAQQEQFMQKYAAVRKNNGKGDDFATAMAYVTKAMLYHTGGVSTNPGIQVALEETHGTQRLGEVLGVISKLSSSPMTKALIATIKPLLSGVTVNYTNEPMPVNVGEGKTAFRRGVYSAESNSITIYAGGENAHTVVHEAVHAATVANLARMAKVAGNPRTQADAQTMRGYNDLVALYTALKEMPEFKGEYAFKNLYEFVAEVYSNPRLQIKLAMVQAPKGLFAKAASLMDAFINAVRDVLGLRENSTDALSESIRLTGALFEGKAQPSTGSYDSLSTPIAAVTAPFTKLQSYTSQVDAWTKKVPFQDLKAAARKVWLGLVSSDYIKDAIERSPGLGKVADAIGDWFKTDRLKTQVKNLISKDVYDGFVRKLELALKATGNYTKYNELMGLLAGEASRIGFNLAMNYDQNVAAGAKIDARMRQEVNMLHQKFRALSTSSKAEERAVANLILEGEKVNRKLYTMQIATLARNILDAHASGPSSDAAANLLNQFDKKLDILMDTKGLTNSDKTKHLDALASTLHKGLEELFAVFDDPNNSSFAKGDLHDDMDLVRKSYTRAWDAPYMHLGRHGMQHIAFSVAEATPQTVAKLNSMLGKYGFVLGPFMKGSKEVFLRVDSRDEMMQIFNALKASTGLIAEKDGKQLLRAGALSDVGVDNMAGVSKAMEALRKRMQDKFAAAKPTDSPATKAAFDAVRQMLNQEFLDMLEVNSAKQVNQLRKGVPGYSADYMQNFAKRAQWSDASIASQYTTRGYTKAFRDMQNTVTDLQSSDPLEASKGQDIHDELATRFANSLKPVSNPLIHKMSVFGHNFYLALSPAYTIGNMLQPYVLTLPLLGGRHGFVKSSKAMAGATADTFALVKKAVTNGWHEDGWRGLLDAKLDLTGTNMTQREVEFLQHLIRSGIVDATQSQELGRMAKGESSTAATAAKTLSAFNHYSEVFNRLSAGLAAYRLADKLADKPGDMARTNYAIDTVRRTQYDYADHNKARFIGRHGVLGAATPLFMQFQTFAFFTMENYIRMFKDGFINKMPDKEKAEARKALGGTLVATALVAGTMGLPFATVMAAVANAAGGGDDKDAREKYREWLTAMFGKGMAEMVAKGPLSRSLGIDVTGSLGHQDLLPGSRWMADRRQWEDKVKDMSKSMLGPAVNAGFDIYGGVEKVKEGDVMGGIKAILPRALKGPAEAVKTAEEGAFVNKAGTSLPMPVTSWDYFKMALGFNPSKKAEQSEANFYYQSELSQAKQDKSRATKAVLKAIADGDVHLAATLQSEYNAAHPTSPMANLNSMLRSQARAKAVAEASGTGILDGNIRHWATLSDYTAHNTGL